ncbi:hypothetical protein ACU8KH_02339 [Lachancea thermotolerans]
MSHAFAACSIRGQGHFLDHGFHSSAEKPCSHQLGALLVTIEGMDDSPFELLFSILNALCEVGSCIEDYNRDEYIRDLEESLERERSKNSRLLAPLSSYDEGVNPPKYGSTTRDLLGPQRPV